MESTVLRFQWFWHFRCFPLTIIFTHVFQLFSKSWMISRWQEKMKITKQFFTVPLLPNESNKCTQVWFEFYFVHFFLFYFNWINSFSYVFYYFSFIHFTWRQNNYWKLHLFLAERVHNNNHSVWNEILNCDRSVEVRSRQCLWTEIRSVCLLVWVVFG